MQEKLGNTQFYAIIWPVVSYRYELWSVILKKNVDWRYFENRVLRRLYGAKKEGLKGGWIKIHIEELHNVHLSDNNMLGW